MNSIENLYDQIEREIYDTDVKNPYCPTCEGFIGNPDDEVEKLRALVKEAAEYISSVSDWGMSQIWRERKQAMVDKLTEHLP